MLSERDRAILRERYAGWGVDAVKDDLKRPFRWVFGTTERTEFAQEWVSETEQRAARRQLRRKRLFQLLAIAAVIQFAVVIGLSLPAAS